MTTTVQSTSATAAVSDNRLVGEITAAEFLNVKRQTLSVWRLRGCGPPFYKIGRCVKYSLADLAAYVASRRCQNTAEADQLD